MNHSLYDSEFQNLTYSSDVISLLDVHHGAMIVLILILILLAITGVLGFVIKGLLWLGLIAVALFVIAAIWGWVKQRAK